MEEVISRLRKLKRGLEMSAGIMRDVKRTSGWTGAERVARSYERYSIEVAAISELILRIAPLQFNAPWEEERK